MWYRSLFALLSVASIACVDHSSTDPRQFHCEVLSNGLRMLIVEDPKATESAAAMYVDVGSNENPEGREGLAHFLEHMLFISTDEYPEVDAAWQYVSAHGGKMNAYTGHDRTVYYFSVKPEYFEEGVKIFSAFFISPSFESEYVDRERHAVHSEFIVSKESDGWRQYHLTKTLLSEHPANRFSTGNLDTLYMEGLREDLVDFYQSHYSSDKMYFVAVVPKASHSMIRHIKHRLNSIEKRDTLARDESPQFKPQDLGRVVHYRPVSDIEYLDIDFVLPGTRKDYLKPSTRYIERLMGDEGPGSIIHALRSADLATDLSVSSSHLNDVEDVFNVHIKLTRQGLKHKGKVIATVMNYIDLMKQSGVEKFRFNEMQKVSYLHYLYYSQQSVVDQAMELVSNMRDYPARKWYNAHYVLQESQFDPEHIHTLLNHMQLDNALIFVAGQSLKVNQVEPIYGAEYAVFPLTEWEDEHWTKPSGLPLALPKRNVFIPNSLEMLDIEDTDEPIKVATESWYKRGEFDQPKQYIAYAKVLPPESVSDVAYMMLISKLLEQEKMTKLYPAILAGGFIHIGHDEQGLLIEVGGTGDKQAKVLDSTIQALYDLDEVSKLQFEQAKENLINSLENIDNEVVYRRLAYQLQVEMHPGMYNHHHVLSKLERISYHDFKSALRYFLEHAENQTFVYGNIDKNKVKRFSPSIEVPYKPIKLPKDDRVLVVESPRSDHAVILYHQMEQDTDRDRLCAAIIANMIKPQIFKQLRTEEQMGYVVFSHYSDIYHWPGIVYGVQSPSIQSREIKSRMEKFLHHEVEFDEAAFETLKAAMIIDLEKPFETMGSEFMFYWTEIHSGRFDYDKRARFKDIVKSLTVEDIRQYYAEILKSPRQLSLMSD